MQTHQSPLAATGNGARVIKKCSRRISARDNEAVRQVHPLFGRSATMLYVLHGGCIQSPFQDGPLRSHDGNFRANLEKHTLKVKQRSAIGIAGNVGSGETECADQFVHLAAGAWTR
jgi:ABC-type sugar transport system ATPase subunit